MKRRLVVTYRESSYLSPAAARLIALLRGSRAARRAAAG
jgi:hypothetical protein